MDKQDVVICSDFTTDLYRALSGIDYDKLYLLVDENTQVNCRNYLDSVDLDYHCITIGAGDVNKNLDTLSKVWEVLSSTGATRHSLLINLGGGMVTDLGGFAAATFKRGIPYINIPTTLLSMVDAAVGGKTGINFSGLKNEIGVFRPARAVLIDSRFLRTLDRENLLSGYAEMIKHGLISSSEHWAELLDFDFIHPDYKRLQDLIAVSVNVKENIVRQDPYEQGIRKALNLGHTVGHSFESFSMQEGHPVLHGYAVAWGMICELYLATIKTNFPKDKLRVTVYFIRENYGSLNISCNDYDRLYELMTHDKKNIQAGEVNFTLLGEIGDIRINQIATKDEICESLDFFREAIG